MNAQCQDHQHWGSQYSQTEGRESAIGIGMRVVRVGSVGRRKASTENVGGLRMGTRQGFHLQMSLQVP